MFGSDYWKRLIHFDVLVEEGAISEEDLRLFQYVDDPEVAWEGIKRFYDLPDACPCQEATHNSSPHHPMPTSSANLAL